MNSRGILAGAAIACALGLWTVVALRAYPALEPVVAAHAQSEQQQRLAYEQNTIDVVKRYGPSVVAINVTVRGQRVNPMENLPPELRRFFRQFGMPNNSPFGQPQQRTIQAAGSGFVVDREGQILTNFHVISNALQGDTTHLVDNASITVQFPGGDPLPVKVVGVDQSYDLALLQLYQSGKLPADVRPIPLADSDRVEVGEKAIAIGNPFALQSTVTQGIVSAINRRQQAMVSGVPIPYVQTDAAINPGNSGGPLLNSQGQVIGVNDEILAPNGTFVGVGLAIPSSLVKTALPKLRQGGFIKKAEIGVTIIPLKDYPKAVRAYLRLPADGLMIVHVIKGSPGAKAGLHGAQFSVTAGGQQWPAGGDIILKANGKPLHDGGDLQNLVFSKSAGSKLHLTVLSGGKERRVTVTLEVIKSGDGAKQ